MGWGWGFNSQHPAKVRVEMRGTTQREVDSNCGLLIVSSFRGSSRFEILILSHHFRYTVACECTKEDEVEPSNSPNSSIRAACTGGIIIEVCYIERLELLELLWLYWTADGKCVRLLCSVDTAIEHNAGAGSAAIPALLQFCFSRTTTHTSSSHPRVSASKARFLFLEKNRQLHTIAVFGGEQVGRC